MDTNRVKYPRSPHLPWSPGASEDDIIIDTVDSFVGKEVVVTEKMDGECVDGKMLVTTPHGDISIKELCENDTPTSVLSKNILSGYNEFKPVLFRNIKNKCDDWYRIELENGAEVILTGNHEVWVENLGAYRRVSDLDGSEVLLLKK